MTTRPRQNRVTPFGELVADPARGTLMGNRGCLHDERGRIRRSHAGRRWIFCRLEFKGRRRELMRPNRYTELFFLDEATAFAAGHRPCAECMRRRFDEFRDAWEAAGPAAAGARPSANAIDRALHAERLNASREKVTFTARVAELPDGVLVVPLAGHGRRGARLIWRGDAPSWSPAGYRDAPRLDPGLEVEVLTPRSTVGAFAAGLRPRVSALPER